MMNEKEQLWYTRFLNYANSGTNNGICEIKIGSLHPFPNHPFQVKGAGEPSPVRTSA